MALSIKKKGNRIIVTGTTSTAVTITDKNTTIDGILWVDPSTAAHLVTLKDLDGDLLSQFYCVNAHVQQQICDVNMNTNGIVIDDMDSGTILIVLQGIGV